MYVKSANFIVSNTDVNKCPKPSLPEYAFIGRSNVGKSSLINMLTNKKELAKVSSKPGKTQLINHFLINDKWYLVDLPGYGYARVSKSKRQEFSHFIKNYLIRRKNLMCLFVLIDSRLAPQEIDLNMQWLANKVPFVMVLLNLTNCLKQRDDNFKQYKKRMLVDWEELPSVF